MYIYIITNVRNDIVYNTQVFNNLQQMYNKYLLVKYISHLSAHKYLC